MGKKTSLNNFGCRNVSTCTESGADTTQHYGCVCYFLQKKVIYRDIQLIWLKQERLQEAGGSEHSCQHLVHHLEQEHAQVAGSWADMIMTFCFSDISAGLYRRLFIITVLQSIYQTNALILKNVHY